MEENLHVQQSWSRKDFGRGVEEGLDEPDDVKERVSLRDCW